jgi:hypothetical protein
MRWWESNERRKFDDEIDDGGDCPHCGEEHSWTSGHLGLAMQTLHSSPDATRVLVDGGAATALP